MILSIFVIFLSINFIFFSCSENICPSKKLFIYNPSASDTSGLIILIDLCIHSQICWFFFKFRKIHIFITFQYINIFLLIFLIFWLRHPFANMLLYLSLFTPFFCCIRLSRFCILRLLLSLLVGFWKHHALIFCCIFAPF